MLERSLEYIYSNFVCFDFPIILHFSIPILIPSSRQNSRVGLELKSSSVYIPSASDSTMSATWSDSVSKSRVVGFVIRIGIRNVILSAVVSGWWWWECISAVAMAVVSITTTNSDVAYGFGVTCCRSVGPLLRYLRCSVVMRISDIWFIVVVLSFHCGARDDGTNSTKTTTYLACHGEMILGFVGREGFDPHSIPCVVIRRFGEWTLVKFCRRNVKRKWR